MIGAWICEKQKKLHILFELQTKLNILLWEFMMNVVSKYQANTKNQFIWKHVNDLNKKKVVKMK